MIQKLKEVVKMAYIGKNHIKMKGQKIPNCISDRNDFPSNTH